LKSCKKLRDFAFLCLNLHQLRFALANSGPHLFKPVILSVKMSVFSDLEGLKTVVPQWVWGFCACQLECQLKPINLRNRRGCVRILFSTLHIMLQCHGGGCVSSGTLGLLNVLCRVVKVGKHCGPEPSRCDAFFKTRLPLDSLTHLADH